LGLKDLRVKSSRTNDLAAILLRLVIKEQPKMGIGADSRAVLGMGILLRSPKLNSLSRSAGWKSVISAHLICDENLPRLECCAAAAAEKVGVAETAADFFKKLAGEAPGEGLMKFPRTAPEPEDTLR
jgi:hypothetical protein